MAIHPMVSHCYLRDHELNLWFTLASRSENDADDEVNMLGNQLGAEIIINLPAIRVFKIGAYFKIGNSTNQVTTSTQVPHHRENHGSNLSVADRAIINELQQDLPLNLNPYYFMSNKLSMDIDTFLNHCNSLIQRGIIRRYSASVNHNSIGLLANSMTCWQVPLESIEKTGRKIAKFREVSHCYQRRTSSLWPYNLFAMIHADTRETCQTLALQISQEVKIDNPNPIMLFSTKEIKKTRILYKV
jgi:DNA-binding Lrp family transcriptional regulator